jgi:thiamine-monophosphate kinase
MKLSNLGESGLLALIRDWTPSSPPVRVGVGDDAAVLEIGDDLDLVVSTDAFVEDTHFRVGVLRADEIGHRAMAGALSDLAAMGAEGRAAFIGLHLPSDTSIDFVRDLYRGLDRVASPVGVQVAGGDTVRGHLALDITAIGTAPRGQSLLRSGAREGDRLFVSGTLGRSEAGRRLISGEVTTDVPQRSRREAEAAHRAPQPRFDVARLLTGLSSPDGDPPVRPTAMIDVSDGLALDLHRLCEASGVGCRVEEESVPVDEAAKCIALSEGRDASSLAFEGGEDYELLFTMRRQHEEILDEAARHAGIVVAPIGEITAREAGTVIMRRGGAREELPAAGWDHFDPRG